MAEIYGEGFAPNAEVSDVIDGELSGKGEDDRLPVVATKRVLLAIFVRDSDSLGCWPATGTYPELGI